MDFPGFVGGMYQSQAVTADQELTVNFYVEHMEVESATTKSALYPTPGVESVGSVATGSGRGHYFVNGREFAVIGSAFLEIDQAGTITNRGTVAYDSNPATISCNGDNGGQVFVTSGGSGYIFTLSTNAFAVVASPPWATCTMGAMLDDYFLALDSSQSRLYVSNLLDGTTWNSTQFAARSLAPDRWVAMKVLGRYIWLLGQQTSEIWYDAGTFPFPFAPYAVGLVPHGCAAPWSVRVAGNSLCWLQQTAGGGPKVVSASGFSPEEISTLPLQQLMSGYTVIDDAVGDSYTSQGHTFYLLTFQNQDITWAYDQNSQTWTQRGTWDPVADRYAAWRPRWHAYAYGVHRMLDSQTGTVWHMDSTLPNDANGNPVRRLRRAPGIEVQNARIYYSAFELDLEPGLGLANGQGSNPQVMMRMSNDGGKTWGTEQMRSAGAVGQYGKRVRWNRCGMARRRVFEVAMSDPIPWRVTGAYLDLGSGGVSQQKQRQQQ